MADAASSPSTRNLLKRRLTKRQYDVTQLGKNEPAFTGKLLNEQAPGDYHCIVCKTRLFDSASKFRFESGWPSFNDTVDPEAVVIRERLHLGSVRSEVTCARCDAFLGLVEADTEQSTGLRYSINSSALKFTAR